MTCNHVLDRRGQFEAAHFRLWSSVPVAQAERTEREKEREKTAVAWRRRALTRAALWPGGVPPNLQLTEITQQPQVLHRSGFALTSVARTSSPPGKPCAETPSRSCTACVRPIQTSTPTRQVKRQPFCSFVHFPREPGNVNQGKVLFILYPFFYSLSEQQSLAE